MAKVNKSQNYFLQINCTIILLTVVATEQNMALKKKKPTKKQFLLIKHDWHRTLLISRRHQIIMKNQTISTSI